ncbi:MAG: sigma-70 family RNA polymerase sigma factor [Thermomicrobiales bacterium]
MSTLYDRYSAGVHGVARMVLRDEHLAEETTHDVFLGLWRKPSGYDPSRGAFAPWLLRVARNRSIDALRRRREQTFSSLAGRGDDPPTDPAARLIDPDPDPAEQPVALVVGGEVRLAMESLTLDQRRLLTMAYNDGLTQREIADALERPLGTVKTQIRVAMRRMAEILAPESTERAGFNVDKRDDNDGRRVHAAAPRGLFEQVEQQ